MTASDPKESQRPRLELCLASEVASTELAEDMILQFSRGAGFGEEERQTIGLAVREAVVNAIFHGNRCDPEKKVLLTAEVLPWGLVISVQDEGSGFDPEALPDPCSPECLLKESGRGVLLMKSLMDEVTVCRRSSAGMEVILKKHFARPTLKEEPTMSLKISNRKVDGVTILDLSGRLVLGEATSALRETLKGLTGSGEKKLLLNLAEVSYIDSSGLGALVSGYTTVTSQQGQMKLVNLNTRVHDLLRVTKLVTVFEVHDDEGKAVKSFA